MVVVAAAFLVPPLAANEYWLQAVLIPFLIYALAAIGLNLLTGYAGQVSLGTGGFMAVGAYSAFKLSTSFPGLNIIVVFPSRASSRRPRGPCVRRAQPRIKGFYLAVATLAAPFSSSALQQGAVVRQLRFVRHHHRADRSVLGVVVSSPEATAGRGMS
jgi:branched-chain amino acid transport system permease protein